jgi:hypothetical protein
VWARLFDGVADDPDLPSVLIDAMVAWAHACAAGAPPKTADRRRKAWGAHAVALAPRSLVLVDALGNPLTFMLTSGTAGDNPQALPSLAGTQAQEVVADRGYDAGTTIAHIEQQRGPSRPSHPSRTGWSPATATTPRIRSAISSSAALGNSSTSGASSRASTSTPRATWPSSTSRVRSSGSNDLVNTTGLGFRPGRGPSQPPLSRHFAQFAPVTVGYLQPETCPIPLTGSDQSFARCGPIRARPR